MTKKVDSAIGKMRKVNLQENDSPWLWLSIIIIMDHTANVYRQRTDKLLFLYAIITHENV